LRRLREVNGGTIEALGIDTVMDDFDAIGSGCSHEASAGGGGSL